MKDRSKWSWDDLNDLGWFIGGCGAAFLVGSVPSTYVSAGLLAVGVLMTLVAGFKLKPPQTDTHPSE